MKKVCETFFENINTEVQAYLLGFFVGDGSITLNSDKNKGRIRYSLKVSVKKEDDYILEWFIKNIACNSKIYITQGGERIIRNKKFITKPQSCLCIDNKNLVRSLHNLGYEQNKTYKNLSLPKNITSKELMRHFIRGYFDADGVISTSLCKRNDRPAHNLPRVKSTFCITSKTKNLLFEIQKYLQINLNIDVKLYYEAPKDVYNLKTSSNVYIKSLYNFFYKDSDFYLHRKKESFEIAMLTPREFRILKNYEPRNA
jgi:hypothetical protein